MLKILRVICSVNPAAGGPINGLINSSKLLVELGHQVEVLSLDSPDESWVNNFEYPLKCFKGHIGSLNYSRKFSKWINDNVEQYNVVIIHGIWQYHSYATAKACKNNNVPYVLFTHGMLDPWFNINQKIKTLKKIIYWKLFESYTINNANAVLFTSEEEKTLARKSFSPYQANETVVAYGSPLPDLNEEQAVNLFYKNFPNLKNKKIAIFLSRIHQKKGVDLLIEAMGKLKSLPEDFMLVIAGPDSTNLQSKLEKLSESLGIKDKILWVGMLQGDIKWGGYHASDVFILPSHQENFGIVVAEALSTSTPVLITNKVNIWREIKEVDAGFVENDDVKGITNLLNNWLNLTNDEIKVMNDNALKCYQNNFSIDKAVTDLEKILFEIVDK